MMENNIKVVKFGCLVPLKRIEGSSRKEWECKCECGNSVRRLEYFIVNPKSPPKACSRMCPLHGKNKHGAINTKEYRAWVDMKQRCLNEKNSRYEDYGGRGVKVHPRWLEDFNIFLKDVGKAPTRHHSLDRIDNDADYTPDNVRWAHRIEQQGNRRNTVFVDHRGEKLTLTELSEKTGVPRKTLYARLIRGACDITQDQPRGPKKKKGR
jgi:hypothetical protein